MVTRKIGNEIKSLLRMLRCSMRKKSAIIRRAERNAVSPLVMGAATIPNIASKPPMEPSQSREMSVATFAPE